MWHTSVIELLQLILESIFKLFTVSLFHLGNTPVSISLIFQLILALLIVALVARALKNFLAKRLLARMGIEQGHREAIATIISYSLGTLGFIILLQTTGFNLASLAVLAGALGVGIGLGLQDVTKNFISGLTLMVERTVKVGDFVEFDGLEGYVKTISIRSAIIRTKDGGDVVVPNSQLVENRLLNWSYESFVGRIRIPVGVAYGSNPVSVTETLLASAYMEPTVLHNPAPQVFFRGFGDSALNFELRVWVNRIDFRDDILSSLNFIIEYNLRKHEITIPFPQRDLWLRNPETLMSLTGPQAQDQLAQGSQTTTLQEPLKPSPKPLLLRNLLREVTYFHGFSELQLRQLIEIGYRKRLEVDEILFRESDPGDAFYIILSGSVEVFTEKLNKQLTTLQTGQFFGELALMLGIPRTATVKALEDTILFVINQKGFEKLLKEHPELAEGIVQELGKYQEELSERQQQLRALGLVDEKEDDKNPVLWVRKRLKNLFSL